MENKDWADYKKLIDGTEKMLLCQYRETETAYYLEAYDGPICYSCTLFKANKAPRTSIQAQHDADRAEFESDYKSGANQEITPIARSGQPIMRADSRPMEMVTVFCSRGDAVDKIGGGKALEWDFSTADDEVSVDTFDGEPIPTGYKRKRIDVTFNDPVHIKEGTVYHYNAPKGQYLDMYVLCPDASYYIDPNGTVAASTLGLTGPEMYTLASGNVPVQHYVHRLPCVGDVPMGDELNTEGAADRPAPAGYIFRLEITTPDTDITSYGYVNMEMYRSRSILLPGEAL